MKLLGVFQQGEPPGVSAFSVSWFLLLFCLCSGKGWGQAISGRELTSTFKETDEFHQEQARLKARYTDFFQHRIQQKTYRQNIERGIGDQKKSRESVRKSEQEALQQYRLELKRRTRADDVVLERQHLAQNQTQVQAFEQQRRAYVEMQKKLKKLRQSTQQIPENQDAGLEP